jgi:PAS domain S-box-containing protein
MLAARKPRARMGRQEPFELSYVKKDGSRIPLEFSPGTVRTRDGQVHVFAIVKDLTDRKRRETKLKESEETFRRIAETSTDAIYQLDLNGIFIYCSPSAETILGYKPEELVGTNFRTHFLPEDLPAAEDTFVRNLNGEDIERAELRILNKSRKPVVIEVSATPIRKDGWIIGSQGIARDITERKAVEESLRASEARLRTVIESVPFDFFFIDETGRYAMQNTRARQMWGDFVGERPEDVAPDDESRALWLDASRRAFAGETVEGEWSFRIGDEESHFYNIISPVREGDRIRGILGVNIDITERKRVEAALRASEEKYRFLVENTGTAVTFWDVEGRLVFINRIAARYLGREPDELIGVSVFDVVPERVAGEAFAAIREALGSGTGIQGESEVDLPQGKRWFRSYLQPVVDAERKLIGVQVVSHDITELTQAERALRERDARLRLMVSQLPALVWSVDRELRFTSSAGAGLKVLGLAPGQAVGMTLFEYFQSRDPDYLPIVMHRKSLDGETTTYEMVWNGRTWESHTEPLRTESGEIIGCLGIGLDVTARRQAEEDLRRSREALRALAGRVQEVREEESANIAREIHDELGQALSGIKFDLSFIHRRVSCCEDHEERAELEDKIAEMNKELDATINAVRRISTQLRPKILDDLGLVGAIEWQARDFERRANIACSVNAYGTAADLELEAPRATAVFRIFQEILTNVRRHAAATHVFVDLRREDDALLLEVRDNGKGIPRKQLRRLDGLGILGMRERAQVFGGHVAIESVEGKGTSVKVTIPAGGPS